MILTLSLKFNIGINIGRIRGINSRIRGRSTILSHPQKFEATVRVAQNVTRWVSDCTLTYL